MLAAILALWGCTDELTPPQAVEPGLPARITVRLSGDAPEVIARGDIAPGLDRAVGSLWIAVYDAESGARTGMTFIHPDERIEFHELREVTLDALSGPSYIVGVANFEHRPGFISEGDTDVTLEQALTDADTWEKFNRIYVAFDKDGGVNIDAPLNPLLMYGHYSDDKNDGGRRPEPAVVSISPGASTPSGAVHLRSLISQVKFKVTYNKSNISSFNISSWRVVNLPATSWLGERTDDDTDRNAPDLHEVNGRRFTSSDDMTGTESSGNTLSFDFWTLENRRTGQPAPAGYDGTPYSWRELQYKDADGANTGRYRALASSADDDGYNNMATYVEMNVDMEMTVDSDGNPLQSGRRTVHATYRVHLGYCEGDTPAQKATDFNCRRNSRYTYNVTVNNVSDILVEARREGEPSPGAEGNITDITDSFYQLDAHFSAVPVYFTADELAGFRFFMEVCTLDGTELHIDSADPSTIPAENSDSFMYYSWVEFRRNTTQSGTYLESYKPRSSGSTYLLGEMGAGRQPGWYTMFINEYVYETGRAAMGYENESVNWHGYVNRPDRRVWINVTAQTSADGQSVYYNSKYALSQHSIQTYYDLGATTSGLGTEHVNESYGLNLRNNYRYSGDGNHDSARYNMAEYLASPSRPLSSTLNYSSYSPKWSTFLNLNSRQSVNAVNNQGVVRPAQTHPLPAILQNNNGRDKGTTYNKQTFDPDRTSGPKYVELMRACLNRNRDLNGDGVIDASEIRWMIPTNSQYVRMILGRNSLSTPIFDITHLSRLPNGDATRNGENSSMLAATSDGRMMWLMEGTSVSSWRQNAANQAAPWAVRCIRVLGADLTVISNKNVTEPAFFMRTGTTDYIVDLSRYDSKSIRNEAYRTTDTKGSWMPVHHIYDQNYNRCYRAFEFYPEIIYLNDPRLGLTGTTINWSSYLSQTNPCAILNTTAKNGWRVPNQKEMSIISVLGYYNLNAASGHTYSMTCSYTYFDKLGYTPGTNPADPAGSINSTYRFPLKARMNDGAMTQSEDQAAVYVNSNYYGVRCVRDVD